MLGSVFAIDRDTLLIIGLGNPGKEYINTRHNVGFKIIDWLAEKFDVSFRKGKGNYRIAKCCTEDVPLILAKPLTYMNLSGEAASDLVMRYHINPLSRLLVVCDDLNLPLGRMRFRHKGSDGGNKGLRSIIEHLHTGDFPRLRIGIRTASLGDDYPEYVLSRFSKDEYSLVCRIIEIAGDAILTWVKSGIQDAMNAYNSTNISLE